MPTYDYVCSACGHRLEVFHGVHDSGPARCPDCGAEGTMRKALVAPAIHFKGSGWAKKDRAATATPGKAGASPKKSTAGDEASTSSPATQGTEGTATSSGAASGSGSGGAQKG